MERWAKFAFPVFTDLGGLQGEAQGGPSGVGKQPVAAQDYDKVERQAPW